MKSEPPPFQIAKPCPKKWDEMSGDAKRRFCEHCQLHVHNLSSMTGSEREEFVAESKGRACIAYEVRGDGSMVTPSRWSRLSIPLRRIQQAAAALLAACLPMLFSACATRQTMGKPVLPKDSKEPIADGNRSEIMVGLLSPLPSEKEMKP